MDKDPEREDIRTVYNAVVDYHNNLVHMRFTVAGLYLAASGFLVGALFGGSDWCWTKLSVALLGLAMTAIAWLLEIRTYQLLENLGNRGYEIEDYLNLGEVNGFFELMKTQPIFPLLPFIKIRLTKCQKFIRYIISHSFGLDLLYLSLAIFWILMLIYYK